MTLGWRRAARPRPRRGNSIGEPTRPPDSGSAVMARFWAAMSPFHSGTIAASTANPLNQMTGREITTATGTVQNLFERAP